MAKNSKKHVIWSNMNLNLDDWRDDLSEECPNMSEDELYEEMCRVNMDYLDDERANLNIRLPERIILIADLGRWDGRHNACKVLGNNISLCLHTEEQGESEWYVDAYGDLKATINHHDGVNHYLYRQFRVGTSEEQRENFICKILSGNVTRADINRYTIRLGDYIAMVYGWTDIPRMPKSN